MATSLVDDGIGHRPSFNSTEHRIPSLLAACHLLGDGSYQDCSNDESRASLSLDATSTAPGVFLQHQRDGISDAAHAKSSLLQLLAKRRKRVQNRLFILKSVAQLIEEKLLQQHSRRHLPSSHCHPMSISMDEGAAEDASSKVVRPARAGKREAEVGLLVSLLVEGRKLSKTEYKVGERRKQHGDENILSKRRRLLSEEPERTYC